MSEFALIDISYSENYAQQLEIESKRAIHYLQVMRGYRYVEFLAQGGYGWVSVVYDDSEQSDLAVKCVTHTSEMELNWWPKLDHDSILPLIEYVTLDNITVFIMPAMRKDLWMCVQEPQFYRDELSFGLCRLWLGNVASGLAYLHGLGLCHLDLKLDNIFLKPNGYVCLGDFSLLSDVTQVSEGMFLEVYLPPEYCDWCHAQPPMQYQKKYRGDKADLWQFGILSIDLLTRMRVSRSCGRLPIWRHDVWPLLEKLFGHPDQLNCLLEESFECVLFAESDFKLCYQFVTELLKLDPNQRTSAEEMTNHPFVKVGWPHVPSDFNMPSLVTEHPSESEQPSEVTSDQAPSSGPELQLEAVKGAEEAKTPEEEVKGKLEKIHEQKLQKRKAMVAKAGMNPVNIKHNLSGTSLEKTATKSQTNIQQKLQEEIEIRDNAIIKKTDDVSQSNNDNDSNLS